MENTPTTLLLGSALKPVVDLRCPFSIEVINLDTGVSPMNIIFYWMHYLIILFMLDLQDNIYFSRPQNPPSVSRRAQPRDSGLAQLIDRYFVEVHNESYIQLNTTRISCSWDPPLYWNQSFEWQFGPGEKCLEADEADEDSRSKTFTMGVEILLMCTAPGARAW